MEHVANSRLPSDSAQTSSMVSDIGFESLASLLRSRRTVHDFLETDVPQTVIEDALELACWVPNHRQTEPWRFHLLDRALGLELAALNADLVRKKKRRGCSRRQVAALVAGSRLAGHYLHHEHRRNPATGRLRRLLLCRAQSRARLVGAGSRFEVDHR